MASVGNVLMKHADKDGPMDGMPRVGVEVVVEDAGKILLMRRQDFDVWGLPGGYVDAGESMAEAARREVLEETGLEVELTAFIGLYSFRRWLGRGYHFAAFMGRPVAGTLRPQESEALELRFVDPANLPQPLGFGTEQVVADGLAGWHGIVRSHDGDLGDDYLELLSQRDGSSMSAREFYGAVIAPRLEPSAMSLDIGAPDAQSAEAQTRERVCAAILRGNTILMVRHRHAGRDYWTLPGGGVEPSETWEDAVVREVAEETGLHGTVVRLLYQERPDHERDPVREHCFLLQVSDGDEPRLGYDPEESHIESVSRMLQDVAWVPLDDMRGDIQVTAVLTALKQRL
jgi:8-oxo-dGTP diphosphatase